jgi:septum formation protein
MSRTVLLASASSSRYSLLSNAGIVPLVQVSYVDEEALEASLQPIAPADLCVALAEAKGEAVAADLQVTDAANLLIIAADSMLELPRTPSRAGGRCAARRALSTLAIGCTTP